MDVGLDRPLLGAARLVVLGVGRVEQVRLDSRAQVGRDALEPGWARTMAWHAACSMQHEDDTCACHFGAALSLAVQQRACRNRGGTLQCRLSMHEEPKFRGAD